MKKKTNPELAKAIYLAKKNNLLDLAKAISVPTRMQSKINITELNKSEKASVIVPGTVLSNGEISKKIKVYALRFTEKAKEKLEKAGCEIYSICDSLEKGEKIEGEILK